MAFLDTKLKPYNPKAYVPGGSSKAKAKAITAKGRQAPVVKKKNPYVRPTPGGGSGAVTTNSPSSNAIGMAAQSREIANRAPVSTQLDINYEADPVLARIKALGQKSVGEAESEAGALRKQAVIDTGLADVGAEIGLDAGTLQAARENPLSVAARLQREQALRAQQLDESLNQQNLFWSGHRGTQLGNLAQSGLEEQNNLARDLRAALGGIDSGVLDARTAASEQEQAALEQAAAAARQQALEQALWDALNPPDPITPIMQDVAAGGGNPYDIPAASPDPVWNDVPYTPTTQSIATEANDNLLMQLAMAQSPYVPPPVPMYTTPYSPVPVPDPIYEPDYAYSNAINLIPGADWRYL